MPRRRFDPLVTHYVHGGRVRVMPHGAREPVPGVAAYVRLLLALPWPGARVRLPDGATGEVVEVLRHAGRPCDEGPSWGWRVAVLPDGCLPYETRVYDPHVLTILHPERADV
ncbi:MAG: hypothetical protein KatS3mg042_1294 [Rhodothermaceae bacterium]|nr:MAG: hypothetical protein KatS3mg042_1294 [Rhodothermaceae bacterium]